MFLILEPAEPDSQNRVLITFIYVLLETLRKNGTNNSQTQTRSACSEQTGRLIKILVFSHVGLALGSLDWLLSWLTSVIFLYYKVNKLVFAQYGMF